MGRPPAAKSRPISREIKNWIDHFSAVQAIAICPKCAGLHDPPATPERGTLALDPSDSHLLRLKCSKCKKHLAAASQLKTAVVIAEVPFPPEQTECPCNPDEFLALSTSTANIKDDLYETRHILQTTRDERDELRLEVEKLRRTPDLATATGAGAAEDADRGKVHQEAEDQDILSREQEPRNLQAPTADLNENIQDADTESDVDGQGSTTNAALEGPRQREGSNICVAIEENGDLTFQEEDSIVSNRDLLNAVNAFAAEYRTNTRGLLQEIEDLKLSYKKQAQALKEIGGKVDKYASARSNGHATNDLCEENADRTEQHTKERRELCGAKPTRSTVGDRCTSEVDPDLPQRPHRQPRGKRSLQRRHQSASPRRLRSRLRHDKNNHRVERSMSEEQDNKSNMPLGRTRKNDRPEQQDGRRRASRPEDLENRAPHTSELERTHSEPRPHRNGPNADEDEPPPPSFRDIAQRFLPGEMFLPENAATRMDDQVAEFREKFVNHNSRKTRDAEREPVTPSPIRPIYVRKVKRGPLSVLAAEIRFFLPAQCVRGLSSYGKDCREMLVEESMEQFTRKILIHLGHQPVEGRNPLSFNDRERNADNQHFLDRCIGRAMIRWKRGAENNPHKPAHTWYRTQLDRVAQRYPYIARDVPQRK